MDKVVHFEIPVDNLERAQKFYKTAFGWGMNEIPQMNYTIVHTTEIDENNMPKTPGSINGGMMKRQGEIKSPVITVSVQNIDNAVKKVKDAGGHMLVPKMQVGDMGYSAYVKDTEGNIIGLWQNLK